jgi:hypothetical protein
MPFEEALSQARLEHTQLPNSGELDQLRVTWR